MYKMKERNKYMKNKTEFTGPNAKGWEELYERKAKAQREEMIDFVQEHAVPISIVAAILTVVIISLGFVIFGSKILLVPLLIVLIGLLGYAVKGLVE